MDKKYVIKCYAAAIGMMALVISAIGLAGSIEYQERVILSMSEEEYDSASEALATDGRTPTESEIATWWEEHHNQ